MVTSRVLYRRSAAEAHAVRTDTPEVGFRADDAFCASRLTGRGHRNYGALPPDVDCAAIIKRATLRI